MRQVTAGTVYWITGLSGAGKTTMGTLLYHIMRAEKPNVFRLDGDIARWAYNDVTDFSLEARRACAFRHARVSKMIADQGIDVICCTVSLFHEVQAWNRENFARYVEIFLDVPMDILERRNQKGMYKKAKAGEMKNVMGVDQKMEFPLRPDIHFVNDGRWPPKEAARRLFREILAVEAKRSQPMEVE